MTSTVVAETELDPVTVLTRLVPAASVTGAPKLEACKLIHRLETSPRGVYCSSIGLFTPEGNARVSLGIRTAFLDENRNGRLGIGSGIVWDSKADEEAKECATKARVFLEAAPQWELREAFPGDLHSARVKSAQLNRLSIALRELRIDADREQILNHVNLAVAAEQGRKITLSVRRNGSCSVTSGRSQIQSDPIPFRLATVPILSDDLCHRFKTNSRASYEELEDGDESVQTLYLNQKGLLTEFGHGSLVIELQDGRVITPDPQNGCLSGTYAKALVEAGECIYGSVTVNDLFGAKGIYLTNAVVGRIKAVMVE